MPCDAIGGVDVCALCTPDANDPDDTRVNPVCGQNANGATPYCAADGGAGGGVLLEAAVISIAGHVGAP